MIGLAAATMMAAAPRLLFAQEHRVVVVKLTVNQTPITVAASSDSTVHVDGAHLGFATDEKFYPECARMFAHEIDSVAAIPVAKSSTGQYNFPRIYVGGNVTYQRRVDGTSPYQHWLYFSSDELPASSGMAVTASQLRTFTSGLRAAADKTDSISRRGHRQSCGTIGGETTHDAAGRAQRAKAR